MTFAVFANPPKSRGNPDTMIRVAEVVVPAMFVAQTATGASPTIENVTAVGVLAFIALKLVEHVLKRRPEDKIVAKLDELIKAHVKVETIHDEQRQDSRAIKQAMDTMGRKFTRLVALLTPTARIDDTPPP